LRSANHPLGFWDAFALFCDAQLLAAVPEGRAVQHMPIVWNETAQEWFCARCGRVSDHLAREDAQQELDLFECKIPIVNISVPPLVVPLDLA
jgi:hypothetical protein